MDESHPYLVISPPCTNEWVTPHTCMSQVSHEIESWHTHECFMTRYISALYPRMSHATHMDESCHTWHWVMAHAWMCHDLSYLRLALLNESCHTHECVMPHIRLSWHTHESIMTRHISAPYPWIIHATHMNESPHTWMSQVSHGIVSSQWDRQISSRNKSWHGMPHTATHCNTLQHTATHCSTLQHTAAHCNTLQHTAPYASRHTYVRSMPFNVKSPLKKSHGPSKNESSHTYAWVMAHPQHTWVSLGTHTSESCHTYEWVMAHTSHAN